MTDSDDSFPRPSHAQIELARLASVLPREYEKCNQLTGDEIDSAIVGEAIQLLQTLRGTIADMRPRPISMLLWCPSCHARHIDADEFVYKLHHTHACQECGLCWRPAVVATIGVHYLPGFGPRDDEDNGNGTAND